MNGSSAVPYCSENDVNVMDYSVWIQVTQCWMWMLTCVGSLGNLITIMVILHQLYIGHVQRRRPWTLRQRNGSLFPVEKPVLPFEGHTLLLLHLSFCDLLYSAVNFPLTIIAYGHALDGATEELDRLCPVAAFLRYTNALAEWLTLGLLAFQRCVDLGRWRGTRFFKPAATGFLIGGVWVVSVIFQVIPFIVSSEGYGYCGRNLRCDIINDNLRDLFFTLQSCVPLILMVSGSIGILCHLRKSVDSEAAMIVPESSKRRLVKSSVIVFTLMLLFLVCVIPICIHNVFLSDTVDSARVPTGIVLYMIYWLQYAVNFILYTVVSANFRSAYRRFFGLFLPACRSPGGRKVKHPSSIYHVPERIRYSKDSTCTPDDDFADNQLPCHATDSRETHTRY